jgi:hypothetical protein
VRPLNFTVRGHVVHWGSLVEQTHQAWKLRAMMIGSAIAILFEAAPFFYRFSEAQATLCAGLGALSAFVAFAIPFGWLRCPACRSPWMWRAAKAPRANWLRWLRSQQVCPDCGRLAVPSNNRWRGP